jgi:hypothetical protein
MHEHGFRETNCFTRETLEPRPSCKRLAFDLLRVGFADGVSRGGERAVVDSRRIRIAMLQPKRLEQLLSLDKPFLRPPPEHLCQDDSGERVNRMP